MYRTILQDYLLDLKCLSCVRNGCNYCQILDRTTNHSLASSTNAASPGPSAPPSALILATLLSSSAGGVDLASTGPSGGGLREEALAPLRLSPRGRCIGDAGVCAKVARLGRSDSTGVVVSEESDCYRSAWHYHKYLADHQVGPFACRFRRFN